MKQITPKVCPRCERVPMIWVTPNGEWWAACSNNCKPWHEDIWIAHMSSRRKLIMKWNKLTDDLWVSGVTRRYHKERPVPQDAPYWIPADDINLFYTCSNCGYTLSPRILTCPSCMKRMRPYPHNNDAIPSETKGME